jgi:hypothetical protein
MSAPFFQPQSLSCKCGHEWTGHMPINVRVELWGAWGRGLECPNCGAGPKYITFGPRSKVAEGGAG